MVKRDFEKLKDAIDASRNIRAITLSQYMTSINKVFKSVFGEEAKPTGDLISWADEHFDEVMEYLDEGGFKDTTVKSYIGSLLVALETMNKNGKYDDAITEYHEVFDDLRKRVDRHYKQGKKTEKEEKNWTSVEDLQKALRKMKRELDDREVFKKDRLTKSDFQLLQKWVVGNLYIGDPENNPPLRLDYAGMEIIDVEDYRKLTTDEKEEKNWLVIYNRNKKKFVLNNYKTSAKYGQREIEVGKKLNTVLNVWLKFNGSDYLILNNKSEAMSSNQLGKYVPEVFESTGKRLSANMLRHIWISEKFPKRETDERKDVADKMLHSVNTQRDVYTKSEDDDKNEDAEE